MIDEGLQDLYQDLILDHNARPHNFERLQDPTHYAHGLNPLCGDDFEIFLEVKEGKIIRVTFSGQGCAISKASASVMTDLLVGLDENQAMDLFSTFHKLVTSGEVSEAELDSLGKAAAFSGVKEFPMRVKCASLAWHTLKAALVNTKNTVCTE